MEDLLELWRLTLKALCRLLLGCHHCLALLNNFSLKLTLWDHRRVLLVWLLARMSAISRHRMVYCCLKMDSVR